jgi:peroxiredoxin
MRKPSSLFKRRGSMLLALVLISVATAMLIWWLPWRAPRAVEDFPLALLDGREAKLSDFRGRPLLVNFWATSCAPCAEELPALLALHAEFAPQRVAVLAIAMPYDPPLHVAQFAEQHHLPYPVALDVRADAVRAFGGVPYIPATFLLDRSGRIVYSHAGLLDAARLRQAIELELARS